MSLFIPNNPTMARALTDVEAGIKAIKDHPSCSSLVTKDGRTKVLFKDGTATKLTLGLKDSASEATETRLDFNSKT